MLTGAHLTLLVGPTVPAPAPPPLLEAVQEVQVTHRDDGPSGFQIILRAGRSGPQGAIDYALLANPLWLQPFHRVILLVTVGAVPRVLMDGFITQRELAPGSSPGAATLQITGEDVSVMMDLDERSVEHPGQSEMVIANKILLSYARYGIAPIVMPPKTAEVPSPVERTPVQQASDRRFLQEMAARAGHVFFVTPGPAPGLNRAYWGPPPRLGVPQPALSVNLGPESNTESIRFSHSALNALAPGGQVQDRLTNQSFPLPPLPSSRAPLASRPPLVAQGGNVRRTLLRESGLSAAQALGRAQGMADASSDDALTADGELDAMRYGSVLQARGLVGLRGAGHSHDGLYYVKSVTHTLRGGEYRQRFTLTREGLGSTVPVVRT